jgi:hypothetical protein
VGVAVLILPQEWLCLQLLFGFATFFGVCFGVGYKFFSTRHTWGHVGIAAVWMWGHVEFRVEFTRHQPSSKPLNQIIFLLVVVAKNPYTQQPADSAKSCFL